MNLFVRKNSIIKDISLTRTGDLVTVYLFLTFDNRPSTQLVSKYRYSCLIHINQSMHQNQLINLTYKIQYNQHQSIMVQSHNQSMNNHRIKRDPIASPRVLKSKPRQSDLWSFRQSEYDVSGVSKFLYFL